MINEKYLKYIPKELKDSYEAVTKGLISKKENDANILKWYIKHDKEKHLEYQFNEYHIIPKSGLIGSEQEKIITEYNKIEKKRISKNDSNFMELKSLMKSCDDWQYKKKLKIIKKDYCDKCLNKSVNCESKCQFKENIYIK